jgi:flagellin
MRINHNISALNAYRQLTVNSGSMQKSLEKLSSGYRINRAGDDAAGLAISEKMRGQIRGLEMATRNAQDGISLIQTAEGALNEAHSILQRMRELAVQASNGTYTDTDREEIQKEMNQLTSELNRIGNSTEFNTQKLLDGGVKGSAEASGATMTGGVDAVDEAQAVYTIELTGRLQDGEQISISLPDVGSGVLNLGPIVVVGADDVVDATHIGISSNANPGEDAVDLAAAINAALTAEGLNAAWLAEATGNEVTITAQNDEAYQDAGGNGVTITETFANATWSQTELGKDAVEARAATGTISFTNNVPSSGTQIVINDETFVLYDSSKGEVAPSAANTTGIDIKDMKTSEEVIDAMVAATGNVDGVTLSKENTITLKVTADATGTEANAYVLDVNAPAGLTYAYSAEFHIGANKGQNMTIDIKDMRARALGVSSLAGTSSTVTIDGKTYDVAWAATKDVTDGTSNTKIEAGLSVASSSDAAKAIDVLGAAIAKVSTERSKLGAFQNRLEHTINNLGTSAENLTAAESRIRDVDMAKEMMEFTKQNILNQAATAMLAQANMLPQSVLQLLG